MGLLAAMLAVTGIFGMAAYNVSRRMKELGIRVALGRAHETRDERCGRASNRAARSRIVGRTAVMRLRQPVTRAHCVSGESARSRGRSRRSANDGAAGHCSVRHSSVCERWLSIHPNSCGKSEEPVTESLLPLTQASDEQE